MKKRDLKKLVLTGLILGAIISLTACSFKREKFPEADVQASFSSIQASIFLPKCAECHNSGRSPDDHHNVFLSSYDSLRASNALRRDAFYVPYDPERSKLCQIVRARKMPPRSKGRLSQKEIDAICEWIRKGALESDSQPSAPTQPIPLPTDDPPV